MVLATRPENPICPRRSCCNVSLCPLSMDVALNRDFLQCVALISRKLRQSSLKRFIFFSEERLLVLVTKSRI